MHEHTNYPATTGWCCWRKNGRKSKATQSPQAWLRWLRPRDFHVSVPEGAMIGCLSAGAPNIPCKKLRNSDWNQVTVLPRPWSTCFLCCISHHGGQNPVWLRCSKSFQGISAFTNHLPIFWSKWFLVLPKSPQWLNLIQFDYSNSQWLVAIHGNPRDFSEKISGLGLQAVLPRPRPPWMEWTVVGLLSSSMATEWDDVRRVDFHSYEYLCMTPKKVEYVELWPCLPNPYLV